jgi:hypothetical protein
MKMKSGIHDVDIALSVFRNPVYVTVQYSSRFMQGVQNMIYNLSTTLFNDNNTKTN